MPPVRGTPRRLQRWRRIELAGLHTGQYAPDQVQDHLDRSPHPWANPAPRNLDAVIIAGLASALHRGMSISGACRVVGIGRRTFHEWLTKAETADLLEPYATFGAFIAHAEGTYETRLVDAMHGAALASGDARAILEILRRRFPDEWGRAERLTIDAHMDHDVDPALQTAIAQLRARNEGATPT